MITKVRESSGHIDNFDRKKIVNSLLKESKLVEKLGGSKKLTTKEANSIADDVEKIIEEHDIKYLSAPLIREIACAAMIKSENKQNKMEEIRRVYTRVGLPLYDLFNIITNPEIENANLVDNAETAHKYVADKVLKESAMLLLPRHVSEAHLSGDIHIHDLEYFMTRSFCIDGNTAIPIKCNDTASVIIPKNINFKENTYTPSNTYALTPNGYKKIIKFSRRNLQENEMLYIRTSSGKSLKVTKEHRIPVCNENDMLIKKAGELKKGDILYNADKFINFNICGNEIPNIDLIKALNNKVPNQLLENIWIRGLNSIFNKLLLSQTKLVEILESLGIKNTQLNWFNRGIMPIVAFNKFCDFYNIKEYNNVKIGVEGNEVELYPILSMSSELVKILGFFVADGNYNGNEKNYTLVITGDDVVSDMQQYITKVFGCNSTITEGGEVTNICGIEGKWNKAKQIYFSNKLIYLIFKYIFEIPEKSEYKRLPNIVYNLNNKLLHDFLSA